MNLLRKKSVGLCFSFISAVFYNYIPTVVNISTLFVVSVNTILDHLMTHLFKN